MSDGVLYLAGREDLWCRAGVEGRRLDLEIGDNHGDEPWARGAAEFAREPTRCDVRQTRRGATVDLWFPPAGNAPAGRNARWMLRLIAVDGDAAVEIVERASERAVSWQWRLPAGRFYSHRQLRIRELDMPGGRVRLGAFTQHGQLFDLRDWACARRGERCVGLIALRPGRWSDPGVNVLDVTGREGEVVADMPPAGARATRRSYLLAAACADQALAPFTPPGATFDPPEGYAGWFAWRIARHGFARPERLAAYRATAGRVRWRPPEITPWGDRDAIAAAGARCEATPDLAGGNPLWLGDLAAATEWAMRTLDNGIEALSAGAYLAPRGNPVSLRVLAPAFVTWHLLDVLGELSDEDRRAGAERIALLAELLLRRDFYPWHVATVPPGEPGCVHGLYRGMLNQNFNTDRYAAVGIAGCVLPDHPRAGMWRRHAVEQFRDQMTAFVWPGGCWEESHTYANHVRLVLMPLVAALRNLPRPVDLLTDDRFRATSRFFIRLLSPPDTLLDGHRGIPAVGDHHYAKHGDFTYLFGWMAGMLTDEERGAYLWAWRQTGCMLTDARSYQASTCAPLLTPDPADAGDAGDAEAPALPQREQLAGYGAYVRTEPRTVAESLLVVRCGQAWGHYHHDQGSFWWWRKGRLLCADSGLGDGPMKALHEGHCVLGYPGRQPMQYLDRAAYRITRCEGDGAGGHVVACHVPVWAWQIERVWHEPIPPADRPANRRTFHYRPPDRLTVTDEPVRSPGGVVQWCLHVPAESVERTGPRELTFGLGGCGGTLAVSLPAEPREIRYADHPPTRGVILIHNETPLTHELTWRAE